MKSTSQPMQYIATVGTFDGVHTGHRFLLAELKEYAAKLGLKPLAMVLDTHPLRVVRPADAPRRLSDFAEREQMIRRLGVEVRPLHFSEQTRTLTSAQFIAKIADEIGVKALLVGHDNKFGSDRGSTIEDYKRSGAELGVKVIEAGKLPAASSSAIRKLLLAGDVHRANELLGYPYTLAGTVVHGKSLGRRLGFPTANIEVTDPLRLIPAPGVYATLIFTDETGVFHPSMTNIGHRPTVDAQGAPLSIETHIFDFTADLYGRTVRLRLIGRIRPEERFDSLEALTARLRDDEREARRILLSHNPKQPTQ